MVGDDEINVYDRNASNKRKTGVHLIDDKTSHKELVCICYWIPVIFHCAVRKLG